MQACVRVSMLVCEGVYVRACVYVHVCLIATDKRGASARAERNHLLLCMRGLMCVCECACEHACE